MDNKFLRQLDLADPKKFEGREVVIVGAGGIGAPTALALAKMGSFSIQVYDADGVNEWNQPSTLYGEQDVDSFKVNALRSIVSRLTDYDIIPMVSKVERENVAELHGEILIAAVDNMKTRKLLWEVFKLAPWFKYFVDARMSGEGAMVYSIVKVYKGMTVSVHEQGETGMAVPVVSESDRKFYEDMWHTDEEAEEAPCTAKAIIYNTFMIASLIARSVKGYCVGELVPKEMIFDIKNLVFLTRDE